MVTGTVSAVRFASGQSSFAVLTVQPSRSDQPITVVGELAGFGVGEVVRFSGRWEEHATYGRRFRALSWVPLLPSSSEGLVRYLGSGLVPGIGERIAERIVARFGPDALEVIATQKKRLTEIEGVGKKRAEALSEVIRDKRAEAEGIAFLHGLGLGPALARKIHARFGARTAEQMRLDPYRTAEEIPGIGFLTADKIGRSAGIADDDPRRAEGAVLYVVGRAADEGHVMLPRPEVVARVSALSVPEASVAPAIGALAAREVLVVEGEAVYAPPLHRAEKKVAAVLRRLAAEEGSLGPATQAAALASVDLSALHPTQRLAVERALARKLTVLTGGPGTGKTTTVRAILAALEAASLRVALAAPTGRAAKRLTETTGAEARTIHRLLEWTPGLNRFARCAAEPLETDVVLVDEASMLDVRLAASLLDALAPSARLVLVGDVDQLPPVGAGQVLRALIDSGVAEVVRLTQVFRQAEASAIVRGAHALLRGEVPTPTPAKTRGTGDLFVVPAKDGAEAPATLVRVLRRMAESYGLDPVSDVQVLAPMKKGDFGVDRLNEVLQAELNPEGRARPGRQRFAPGDKVMQTVNDYEREVYNGDLGRVEKVQAGVTYVSFAGVRTSYKDDELEPLALAYAATVHKAQGSEFPAVVVVLHGSHHVMLTRSLLYTALTRAQRLVVLFGDPSAIARAARNTRTHQSFSRLEERLRGR
jgi:exodeoxyribonuclease V alpha subunit